MPSPAIAVTSLSLHALARELEVQVPPGDDVEITGVATIEQAGPGDLAFLANARYVPYLQTTQAAAVLVDLKFAADVPVAVLRLNAPRLAFAQIVERFHPARRPAPGIHPTAIVPDDAVLGADIHVGAYAVLGSGVVIGARTTIHPHVVIYDDVHVGENCQIHSHVSLREGTRLGDDVILQDGTVLGADGFGFEPDAAGHLHKVPQIGIVEIGDDVEIQANAAVDRAAIGATRIGRNAKLDNFVQIGHGCTIGESAVLCGQVGLAGSTHIGKHAMLGGQAGSGGHVTIGDGAKVAAMAGVMRDVEAGMIVGGAPAFEIRGAMRAAGILPKLPDMFKRLARLEKAVAKLQPPPPEEG